MHILGFEVDLRQKPMKVHPSWHFSEPIRPKKKAHYMEATPNGPEHGRNMEHG